MLLQPIVSGLEPTQEQTPHLIVKGAPPINICNTLGITNALPAILVDILIKDRLINDPRPKLDETQLKQKFP